jgi:excinuclease ABC subunit C
MREAITRRLKHLRDWGRPDLIVIDGGRTQLGAVADLLNAENIPFIGRNKSGDHSRNASVTIVIAHPAKSVSSSGYLGPVSTSSPENFSDKSENIVRGTPSGTATQIAQSGSTDFAVPSTSVYKKVGLKASDHVAKLIARLDDEAHRFAVSYHTALKRSGAIRNVLEEIPGVGPATRKKLIRKFGSVAGIRKASEKEIAEAIGPSKAKTLFSRLFLLK